MRAGTAPGPGSTETAPGLIVFSHGNGFPAGTYRVLFDAWRAAGWRVEAVEAFGHDATYPVTGNWPHLRDQLADFVDALGQPCHLVGHSLGGYLSLLAAARRPAQVAGVVLLDSPVIAGWRAHGLHVAKRTGLIHRVSPGRISRQRRHTWPSRQAAHAHFAARSVFARWDARVLDDYVAFGLVDAAEGVSLRFSREVETRIYDTLPHHVADVLRRHPLRCPVSFVGGTQSAEVRQVGLAATRALTHARLSWIEGTHLFPMEHPDETAAQVQHWLAAPARPVPQPTPPI